MAVSAHEAAHALQDADDYAPLELRTLILPLVQAGARFGIPVALFGSLFDSQPMFLLGMLAYVGSIVFHFITLPVEFDASRRALVQLKVLEIAGGRKRSERQWRCSSGGQSPMLSALSLPQVSSSSSDQTPFAL